MGQNQIPAGERKDPLETETVPAETPTPATLPPAQEGSGQDLATELAEARTEVERLTKLRGNTRTGGKPAYPKKTTKRQSQKRKRKHDGKPKLRRAGE